MKTLRTAALAFAVVIALVGCGPDGNAATAQAVESTDSIAGTIDSSMASAMTEVRDKLATENISLDGPTGAPKAEITPAGELLIDGRAVPVTEAQHRLLLDYRGHVAAVASAGAEVGIEGARLATRAVGEALRGVFNGNADQVEKQVEAQAESVRASALKLCERLPAMFETQQALAAALPAFAPYATMDRSDIDECRADVRDGKPPAVPGVPASPQAPAENGKATGAAQTSA
ncbi:hypothetical protein [Cognatilysobacter bugurensis]|uniref:DUF2884 family protein n=1 Tax=Cognatilysobacter bugurensis TaxID=543356 RepID=A0A918SUK5_9GAMM|nr:hypothetical protein [Lysobacter bugurensis]GHA71605.1 hypothetical protein GCM10007067_04980 [Lysobacter bugurensis]